MPKNQPADTLQNKGKVKKKQDKQYVRQPKDKSQI